MRLTKEDGAVLLRAIDTELESQRYRQMRRDEYLPPLPTDIEKSLQAEDAARAEVLRRVRDKIKRQL
ncbi:MAG TPA: hypothetical protein VFY67_16100 [Pyrinomonadaceae bacterium]|nr:hypothetical protein [Pyrinomonadaceae bacterium]